MTASTTRPTRTGSTWPVLAAVAGWLLLLVVAAGRARDELAATLHKDEAIAWTYASLPVQEIPGALSYDVNPPVYFVALSAWLSTGGGGETFLRAVSVLAILAAAAVAFDAARRVSDARAGWLASVFVVLAPSTLALAGLARPYALAFLLGMIALDAAIARVRGGGIAPLVSLAISGALLPLTHYWGGLLLLSVMAGMAVTAWRTNQPALLTSALVATGLALVVAAAPWAATFAEQLGSTPVAAHVSPTVEGLGVTLTRGAGGRATAWVFGVIAIFAIAGVLRRWRRTGQRPGPASDAARVFLLATSVAAVGAVVAVWAVSQVRPLFTPNYAFIVLAPVPIVVGVLLSRRVVTFAATLLGLLVVSIPDFGYSAFATAPDEREVRGPETAIAATLASTTTPGDVVLTSPGRVLAVRYYLGEDRLYLTPIGGVSQGLFDFRDRVTRLRQTDPRAMAERVADRAPGSRIAFVHDRGAVPETRRHQPYWVELDRAMDRIGWALRNDTELEHIYDGELPDPYSHIDVDVYAVRDSPGTA
jgi:hypothetical protein